MGKLISHSTKCSKKAEAQKYMLNYFSKSQGEEITMQPYTYTNFKVFYLDYASARFSKSYQAFVKIALSQFEKVVDPGTEIGKVTSLDVESFISMKRKLVKERIINGYLITLQSAFERAVEFKMLKTNVFRTIKKLKAPNNPPLFLSKDEMDTLLSHEDEERFRVIYRFAAYTGMRMGEIRFLRWRSIDFTKDLISVSNHEEFTTKSKKSRDIPLHPCLREDLLKLKGNPDDYIFLYDKRQYTKDLLSRNFKEVIRRARLNDKLPYIETYLRLVVSTKGGKHL